MAESQVVRVLASSGTSSQVPSRVPLDQTTRNRQMKALAAILAHRLGGQRRPFLILDAPPEESTSADHELSARVAGMRGYLMAATRARVRPPPRRATAGAWIARRSWRPCGDGRPKASRSACWATPTFFTSTSCGRLREQGVRIELPPSTFVVHFGGWKKLPPAGRHKACCLTDHAAAVFGLAAGSIVDIYGFTEQLGVIYPDDSRA